MDDVSHTQDDEERELLAHAVYDYTNSEEHEIKNAPVITRQAYVHAGGAEVFPQRGLLGSILDSM
jgi:hypothetical protein